MADRKMICSSCGAKNSSDRYLCRLCGHQIGLESVDGIRTATVQRRRKIEEKPDHGTRWLVLLGVTVFLALAAVGYFAGIFGSDYLDRGRVVFTRELSQEYVGWEIILPDGEPIQAGLPQGVIEQRTVEYPGALIGEVKVFEGKGGTDASEKVEFFYGDVPGIENASWYGNLQNFSQKIAEISGGEVVSFDAAKVSDIFAKASFGLRYQGELEPSEFFVVYEKEGRVWVVRSNSEPLFETASKLLGPK